MATRLLAAGLTLAMGYMSGGLTLGGCAGAPWPSNGTLPAGVVDKLTDCGKKGPTPLVAVNYDLAFIVHVTEDDYEARVDDVTLTDSTLHLHEVEACMTDALYGMRTPLETLALRRRELAPDKAIAPEARAMLGQAAEVVLLLEVAAVVIVAYATYNVIVHVIEDKHRTKRRRHRTTAETEEPPMPALSAPTAGPTATTVPTATAVPTTAPASRKDACRDMYVDCQAKAGFCIRVTTYGYSLCEVCRNDCQLNKAYSYSDCSKCGFE